LIAGDSRVLFAGTYALYVSAFSFFCGVSMTEIDSQTDAKLSPNQIAYTKAEEWINILSHLVGSVLAVAASAAMIVRISLHFTHASAVVAVCLFSLALMNLYIMSTLYHAQPFGKVRRAVFRRFDHCSVALLIAGTYAPYMLIGLYNMGGSARIWGIVIASVVLAMAVLVIVFNAINVHRFKVFCMIAYVLMGWACVIRVDLLLKLPGACFWYLLAGGIVYTVGMIFYRIKKIPLNHAIWHIFVLGGSILHFVSVFCYLLA
jgi:hemolysin III